MILHPLVAVLVLVPADARQDNEFPITVEIQQAINETATAGGGRVTLPVGTWKTGGIELKSNVDLHLGKGVRLVFTANPKDYLPAVPVSWEGVECLNYRPFVYAYGATNVAITGEGVLECPRWGTWRIWGNLPRTPAHVMMTRKLYEWGSSGVPLAERDLTAIPDGNARPHFIHFNRCKGVRLEGFRIRESPFWTIHLFHSEDAVVRNLQVNCTFHNTDGLDIEMTKNVLVENCSFEQGDDCIVLKSGRNADGWRLNRPTENVIVRNCTMRGHAMLTIGSELSGGVRNVRVENCRADFVGKLVSVKTNRRRGGFVKDVVMRNCSAREVETVFRMNSDAIFQWADFPDYELRDTVIDGIRLEDCSVGVADRLYDIRGPKSTPAKGLVVENVKVGLLRESGPERLENAEIDIK